MGIDRVRSIWKEWDFKHQWWEDGELLGQWGNISMRKSTYYKDQSYRNEERNRIDLLVFEAIIITAAIYPSFSAFHATLIRLVLGTVAFPSFTVYPSSRRTRPISI